MTSGIQAGAKTAITKLFDRTIRTGIRWLLVALLAPCAMAQTPEADRQREYYRELDRQREEQQRRAQEEYQRQLRATEDARKRDQELRDETTKNIEDHRKRQSQAAPGGQSNPDMRAARPMLPAERNVLLGSWRVDSGGQAGGAGLGQSNGTDRNAMARELLTTLSNPCVLMFGKGITFAPSSYSIQALDGSVFRGSVEYSSPQKQVILAITQQSWKTLPFEIEGPNRIVWGRYGCALVRVGAPAANAAVNAPTLAANARTAPAPARDVSATTMAPRAAAVSAPIAPNSLLGRAVALHRDKDFQPALALLQQAVKAEPNDARVHAYLASTYQWLGMGAESARAAETARRLDPNALDILR